VPTRTRHAYFDRRTLSTIDQDSFERITDPCIREPIPRLSGRRIRFITLFVEFDGDTAVKLAHVEPVRLTFDDEGRWEEAEAERARHAAADLLDDAPSGSASPTVVPAAARFVSAGSRWEPTAEQLDSVLRLHGLQEELGTPSGPPPSSNQSDYDFQPRPAEPQPHLRLIPEHRLRPPPITSAELSASLRKRWASWHPDYVWNGISLWLVWDDVDSAVRNLAELALDRLYDDLSAQGIGATGEIITFAMFPAIIEGRLRRGLQESDLSGSWLPSIRDPWTSVSPVVCV